MNRSAAAVSLLTLDGLLVAALRFFPEYVHRLGAGPLALGAVGAATALAGVLWRRPTVMASFAGGRRRTALVGLATVGAGALLALPTLDGLGAVVGWPIVFVGLILLIGWTALGRPRAARRYPSAFGGVGAPLTPAAAAGLAVTTLLLALVRSPLGALRIVLTLIVAAGAVIVVLGIGNDTRDVGRSASPESPPAILPAVFGDLPRLFSSGERSLLVGDALVTIGAAAVAPFSVIVVTASGVETTVFGRSVGPVAVFGAAALTGAAVAAVGRWVAPRVAATVGREPTVTAAVAAVAAFPLVLVSAPPAPVPVVAAFALFGVGAGAAGVRRRAVDAAAGGADTAAVYRTTRDLLTVPAAATGGVLYALSPTLAFGAATVIAAVGVREYLWTVLRGSAA